MFPGGATPLASTRHQDGHGAGWEQTGPPKLGLYWEEKLRDRQGRVAQCGEGEERRVRMDISEGAFCLLKVL